ncbi:uncharacterized protein LOC108845309 [Raphanus sativus]|uniref:Uncharacterized protein LOC108845309 n=1 Tax=Raphanus sativus TaxID=3726 RepID=A0A6J0MR66_RAPSA|nr:uncharacterized protein LOC108845309 [Raphanus sativus]
MSHALDKEMMALSLKEEDEPFMMPDLPQFRSTERNARSIIGRILNPDCQKMSALIHDIPRKWQKQGRVRGVALSKECFQFIFDHEHDLIDVLEKGVHTFNDWALAIDRWVEYPPEDYLQYINIWVQIRNIPVNHYTVEAITVLAEILGEVKVVAFDPDKPQVQDFVRVQVRFHVSKPLRKSKVIDLKEGGSTVIKFNYERVQKRCYECQRLNHERDVCPLLIKQRKEATAERRQRVLQEKMRSEKFLQPDDPLFGVLSEDQVGISAITGRRKISQEVLDEMRRYLLMATDGDRLVRVERVRSSIAEAEKDPKIRKTILRLEAEPVVTKQLDKGKGRVFDFDLNSPVDANAKERSEGRKLMAASMKAYKCEQPSLVSQEIQLRTSQVTKDLVLPRGSVPYSVQDKEDGIAERRSGSVPLAINSTEYDTGYLVTKPSGVVKKTSHPRRRPYIKKRKEQKGAPSNILQDLYGKEGADTKIEVKRKGATEEEEEQHVAQRKEPRVIPTEGSPQSR